MASKEVISDAVMSKDIMERVKDELTLMPSEERNWTSWWQSSTIQGDYENTTKPLSLGMRIRIYTH